MYNKFKIVKINSNYCDYLRNYDNRVVYNSGSKSLRPFIGVLFVIGKFEYFAPLSSPKLKHKTMKNTLDVIKINNGEYGVINFNNMIPVCKENYSLFNLNKKADNESEARRLELLRNQLRWLTENRKNIIFKSKLLYSLYKNNKLPRNVKERCCNFLLLEEKCLEYNYKTINL